jgi:hypothetical protein
VAALAIKLARSYDDLQPVDHLFPIMGLLARPTAQAPLLFRGSPLPLQTGGLVLPAELVRSRDRDRVFARRRDCRLGEIMEQQKAYLSAFALQQMRQSPGSPLLEAVLAALPEPLARWTADDSGVDAQGVYELIIASDRCPCAECLEAGEINESSDASRSALPADADA